MGDLQPASRGAAEPKQPEPPTVPVVPSFQREDVAATLEEMGEAFDISVEDLERLLSEIEKRALARTRRDFSYID